MISGDSILQFSDPALMSEPFDFFRTLRTSSPVCPVIDPQRSLIYFVTSAALIDEVTRKTEEFSSDFSHLILVKADEVSPEVLGILSQEPGVGLLLTTDDPAHKRYRGLVNQAFAVGRVATLAPTIEKIVDELIDDMAAKSEADFVEEFAVLLPTYVIADILGLERDEWSLIRTWSDSVNLFVSRMGSPEREIEAAHHVVAFRRFLRAKIAARMEQPRDDLISNLVNARVDGLEPLTPDEALGVCFEVSVAGNETTRNTLMSGMAQLIRHPDQLQALREDPSLIPNAVEEMLRYETPATSMWRIATRDTELGGTSIPKGAEVLLRYDAGNRDPARFPDPDRFDVRRKNAHNHTSFGSPGIHRCLGQMLARKEMAIAFTKLLQKLHNIRILEGSDTAYWPGLLHRGITSLHIGFDL